MEMHGITGGDDDRLLKEIRSMIKDTIQKELRKDDVAVKDIRRAARNRISNILWERTKQRPMIVVNILEV